MDEPQDVDLVALLPEPLPDDAPVDAGAEELFDPAGVVVEALLLDSLLVDSLLFESFFAPVESPEPAAAPSAELPEALDAADDFFLSASRLSLR